MTYSQISQYIREFGRALDPPVKVHVKKLPLGLGLELCELYAEQPGRGSGTKVMLELCGMAKLAKFDIYLSPLTDRNKEFYKRFDFENHPRVLDLMVRYHDDR